MQPAHNDKSSGAPAPANRARTVPPKILNVPPTPFGLLLALRRRLILALGLGLLLGGLGAAAVWQFAPTAKHQVRTRIEVPPVAHYVVRTSEQIPDLSSHQRHQVAMIKSRLVLTSALRSPEVANLSLLADQLDPVEWLEKELQADFSIAPRILQISMRGMKTDELTVLLNAITKAYFTEVVDRERALRNERLTYLGTRIEFYENQLKIIKEAEKLDGPLPGAKSDDIRARALGFMQQQLGMLERELLQTQASLRQTQLTLKTLKAQEEKFSEYQVSESLILERLNKFEQVEALQKEIRRLEAKCAETERLSAKGKQDELYLRDVNRIARLEKELTEIKNRLRPEILKQLREQARLELQTNIVIQQMRLTELENNVRWLEPEVQRLRTRVENGAKHENLREDMTHYEEMAKILKREAEALKVELAAPKQVRIIEAATVSRADDTKRRLTMAGGVGAGALGLSLFGIAWLEYRSRRLTSPEEVAQGLGMRVLGAVPRISKPTRMLAPKNNDVARQVLTESVDAARVTLLHLARTHTVRTVMVTSAVAGEGKTSLSCHLAVSLARAGLRTLLIDGDLRNPSLHKLFGIAGDNGLNDVLAEKMEVADCIQEVGVPHLSVLPAGHLSEAGLLAISQGAVGPLLNYLLADFDFILFDSSPILPVPDGLLIGQQVDGVLLSVLCEESRVPNIYAAQTRIEELDIRLLGVVVSGVHGSMYGATANYPYPRKPKHSPKA